MSEHQKQIRSIQRDSSLSSEEKTKKIREIMVNINQSKKKKEDKNDSENNIFSNLTKTNIVCNHYNRGCDVLCNTCYKYYPCRLCHDQYEDHAIDRFSINKIRCRKCLKSQAPSNKCISCGHLFGFYYCSVCKLWECDNKKIFHCDKCGICRIGKRDEYVHCDKCNMCIAVEHYRKGHKCVENSIKTNCPVCNEYMFDSVDNLCILKCGHSIHEKCFKELLKKKQYQCPLCKKSVTDMSEHWKAKDQMAALEMIPFDYANKRLIIFCNDCENKSDIRYSFEYRKCTSCGSYNTSEIELYNN